MDIGLERTGCSRPGNRVPPRAATLTLRIVYRIGNINGRHPVLIAYSTWPSSSGLLMMEQKTRASTALLSCTTA